MLRGQLWDANIVLPGKVKVARLRKETKRRLYRLSNADLQDGNLLPTLLHPDFDLGDREEISCLLLSTVEAFPIASGVAPAAFGLLLDPVHRSKDTYERLGTFKLTADHFSWFDDCKAQEVILI